MSGGAGKAAARGLAAVLSITCLANGCGGDDGQARDARAAVESGKAARSPTPDIHADAVAAVGSKQITRAELGQTVAGLRTARLRSGRGEVDGLRRRVLTRMVLRETLEHEIFRRGYGIFRPMMKERWRDTRRRLEREGTLDRYLATRTPASIQLDVRIELLRETIHRLVSEEEPKRPQRAIDRFEREFPVRWRGMTVCRAGYEVTPCGR